MKQKSYICVEESRKVNFLLFIIKKEIKMKNINNILRLQLVQLLFVFSRQKFGRNMSLS
jgi:hypothetical protein